MAIAHLHLATYGHNAERRQSVVAHAAYISGTRLEASDGAKDYTRKRGILHQAFIADDPSASREDYWRGVEDSYRFTKRGKAREAAVYARGMDVALPAELGLDGQIALAERMARAIKDRYSLDAIDLAIHAGEGHGEHPNPHIHILWPDRDRNGKKIKQLKKDRSHDEVIYIREELWEKFCNDALEEAGFDERISMKSYDRQLEDLENEIRELEEYKAALEKDIENERRIQHIRRPGQTDRTDPKVGMGGNAKIPEIEPRIDAKMPLRDEEEGRAVPVGLQRNKTSIDKPSIDDTQIEHRPGNPRESEAEQGFEIDRTENYSPGAESLQHDLESVKQSIELNLAKIQELRDEMELGHVAIACGERGSLEESRRKDKNQEAKLQ